MKVFKKAAPDFFGLPFDLIWNILSRMDPSELSPAVAALLCTSKGVRNACLEVFRYETPVIYARDDDRWLAWAARVFPNLYELDLGTRYSRILTDAGLEHVGKLVNLRSLDLAG